MNFAQFVLSDYFLIFWILVALSCILYPFGIYGIVMFWRWINKQFIKPRKGYILVRQKLPNDRIREFLALPTGQFIKFKDLEGREIQVPIKMEKGWVAYDGNLPLIELDENGRQVPINREIKSTISQEEITRGWKAAYEAGKLIGSLEFFEAIKFLIMIVLVVSIIATVAAASAAYFSYTKVPKIDVKSIAQQTAKLLMNYTQPQTQIPKV